MGKFIGVIGYDYSAHQTSHQTGEMTFGEVAGWYVAACDFASLEISHSGEDLKEIIVSIFTDVDLLSPIENVIFQRDQKF